MHRYRRSLIRPSENLFGSLHRLCCFPPVSQGHKKSCWVLNPRSSIGSLLFPAPWGHFFLCNLERAQLGGWASHLLGLPWDGNRVEVTLLAWFYYLQSCFCKGAPGRNRFSTWLREVNSVWLKCMFLPLPIAGGIWGVYCKNYRSRMDVCRKGNLEVLLLLGVRKKPWPDIRGRRELVPLHLPQWISDDPLQLMSWCVFLNVNRIFVKSSRWEFV